MPINEAYRACLKLQRIDRKLGHKSLKYNFLRSKDRKEGALYQIAAFPGNSSEFWTNPQQVWDLY